VQRRRAVGLLGGLTEHVVLRGMRSGTRPLVETRGGRLGNERRIATPDRTYPSPSRLQVEQNADVSRVQMLAGLRAYERSDMRRVPTVHRFPVLDVRPVRCRGGRATSLSLRRQTCTSQSSAQVRSRLPLRGSPGSSPGSLLSAWPRPGAPTYPLHIVARRQSQPTCGG
jgi:hypothetical protein